MAYSSFGKYLESEVFSADPVKQVCMLYRGAIEAIGAARRHLAARQIKERSHQVMRAYAIVRELAHALDPQYAEISRPLSELYTYMQTRLLEANAKQIDAPLAEVERLLSTLLEGWSSAVPLAKPLPADAYQIDAYQSVSCTY
jgi:flagellar protein FliS